MNIDDIEEQTEAKNIIKKNGFFVQAKTFLAKSAQALERNDIEKHRARKKKQNFERNIMKFAKLNCILIVLICSSIFCILSVRADDAPDLIIEDIMWSPANPQTEETIQFTVTVKNQGTLSAGNTFYACLYIDGSYLTHVSVSNLAADASENKTFSWTVDRGISDGTHTVTAYADKRYDYSHSSNNRIAESNENNNDRSETFQVTKLEPDLIVEGISWVPANPQTEETIQFTVTVKNQGTLSAGNTFYACLYIDGSYLTHVSVSNLAADASENKTFSWTVDRGISDGTHTVTAYADKRYDYSHSSNNRIAESNENNNDRSETFQVTKLEPDLIIEDIMWSPANPQTGEIVQFTVTVKNQGTLSAGNTFYACLYIDGSYLTHVSVSNLAADASENKTFSWTVGSGISDGTHTVTAYADKIYDYSHSSNNRIAESNENNNDRSETFQVTKLGPDLIIEDIMWSPANPQTGEIVQFTVTVKNQGTLSAGNTFYACLYIDGSYLTHVSVSNLAADASENKTFSWTVGSGISDGTHTVTAYADKIYDYSHSSNNRIAESNENNNDRSETFQVTKLGPDLIIEDIMWSPANPQTGEIVQFTVTVKNQGTLSAGNTFYACLYIDGSYLTHVSVSNLAADASENKTFSWTVGSGISDGTHTVTAYADKIYDYSHSSNNRIAESNENNNDRSETFQVTKLWPDLIVEGISWTPANPKTGDAVTFTVTYKNQGSLSTGGSFYVCLYVDESHINYNYVDSLAAGASANTIFTWTVDRATSASDFTITAYVDMRYKDSTSYRYITESNESNNYLSPPLPSAPIDLETSAYYSYVNLSWSPPIEDNGLEITNYLIYRLSESGQYILYKTISSTVTSYTDDNVNAGETYYYRVSAVNDNGEGEKSNEVSVTVPIPNTPTVPLNLQATVHIDYVDLSWDSPSSEGDSPITNYKIYRTPPFVNEHPKTFSSNELSFTDDNVNAGETYYYRVSAVSDIGEGAKSNTVTATLPGPPPAPRNLRATAYVDYVDISWDPPSSDGGFPITNYTIYRSTTASGLETVYQITGNTYEFRDNNVTNGQKYYYKVSAVNKLGTGDKLNSVPIIPGRIPSDPTNILVVFNVSGYIHLTWDVPSDVGVPAFSEFEIYRGISSEELSLLTTINSEATEFFDYDIETGETYYYSISAVNNVGSSASSDMGTIECSWGDVIAHTLQKWSWVFVLIVVIIGSIVLGKKGFSKYKERRQFLKTEMKELEAEKKDIINMIRKMTRK